jgi:tetratricopeptide (TPR) repeat protein
VIPKIQSPTFFASEGSRRMFDLCLALLILGALAANMRVVDFGFLYLRDDDINIALNPHMGGLGAERLKWMFTDWTYVRRYIPLGWLNFSATYEFAGLDPRPYHAVALGLFLLNGALVFSLLAHLLRIFGTGARGLTAWEVGAAAFAAAWWLFHPFRVETTAWISGNLYGQSMAFLFASVLAYLRTYLAQGGRRAAWLVVAAAAYAASLLTYPLALGVPVLLIGLDWLHSRSGGRSFMRLLGEKVVFLVPLAGVVAVTVAARVAGSRVFGAVPGLGEFPLLSRIAQSSYIAAYYVWKPLWPAHLSPLYDTLMDFNPLAPPFILSMAAVAAASALALVSFRRRPSVAVIWFGYLACAAPFFGLTERPHMASDRYGYFLTVFTAGLLAAALARVQARTGRIIASAAALAAIGILCALSRRQLEVWRSDRVQHAYVAAHLTNPELLDDFNSRVQVLEFMRGNEKEAEDAVAARLARNPEGQGFRTAAGIMADKRRVNAYYGAVSLLAILQDQRAVGFAKAGELREANDHFEDALRLNDHFYQAAYDRSLVLLRLGRCDDALDSYLLASRWASPPLPQLQRKVFLEGLGQEAAAEGKQVLANLARKALAR